MLNHWRLKINNRVIAWAGVIGVGLVPCPDCGLPLALKIWPVAGLVWAFRRIQRRNLGRLDLLLSDDLAGRATHVHAAPADPVADAEGHV